MLSPDAIPKLGERRTALVAEFIGTFLFILTIPLASNGVGSFAPVPIGFMLCAMVFSFGYLSGAHFNPALSFACLWTANMSTGRFIQYSLVHCAAGLMAACYGAIIIGVDFPVPEALSVVAAWKLLCAELVYTFALANVVLHVTCSKQKDNQFYGFAIGMTVLAAAFSVGGYSGASFNPAVATGTTVAKCLLAGKCEPLLMIWLHWAAPMGGAFLAAMAYNILDVRPEAEPKPENPYQIGQEFH